MKSRLDPHSQSQGLLTRTPMAVSVKLSGPQLEVFKTSEPDCGEVTIQIAALGLCRTDLRVVSGAIETARPLIPGHEFSGRIHAVGSAVTEFKCGDRVVVHPVLPCQSCQFCEVGRADICQQTRFLGVDLDGACADLITISTRSVFPIPETLSYEEAAFAEPVCASLAILKSGIQPQDRGLILGENRIAELTRRILVAKGFSDITVLPEGNGTLPDSCFDFAIETLATTETIAALCRSVVPQGRVILKSRQQIPIELTISELLPKEVTLHAVNYGCFKESIELLASKAVRVDDLIGERFLLNDFAAAFEVAGRDELRKTFLLPNGGHLTTPGA